MNLEPDGTITACWAAGNNDPQADGRMQEGFLVITNTGGGAVERYAVRRRNWGLPVVNIGGTWWCKYNLRGNVTRYEDQVLIGDDPAADAELADYLTTCDDTGMLGLLGDQYQAGNRQGPSAPPQRHGLLLRGDGRFGPEFRNARSDGDGALRLSGSCIRRLCLLRAERERTTTSGGVGERTFGMRRVSR